MISNQEAAKNTAEVLRDGNIEGYARMPIEEVISGCGTDLNFDRKYHETRYVVMQRGEDFCSGSTRHIRLFSCKRENR